MVQEAPPLFPVQPQSQGHRGSTGVNSANSAPDHPLWAQPSTWVLCGPCTYDSSSPFFKLHATPGMSNCQCFTWTLFCAHVIPFVVNTLPCALAWILLGLIGEEVTSCRKTLQAPKTHLNICPGTYGSLNFFPAKTHLSHLSL